MDRKRISWKPWDKRSRRTAPHSACNAVDLLHKACHELVVDPILDDKPCPGDARLARGDKAREGSAVRGSLSVRVVEDDDRRLAAQLCRVVREVLADNAPDRTPSLGACLSGG